MEKYIEKALVVAEKALRSEKNPDGSYTNEPGFVDCAIAVLRGEVKRAAEFEEENKRLKAELEDIKSTLRKLSA